MGSFITAYQVLGPDLHRQPGGERTQPFPQCPERFGLLTAWQCGCSFRLHLAQMHELGSDSEVL